MDMGVGTKSQELTVPFLGWCDSRQPGVQGRWTDVHELPGRRPASSCRCHVAQAGGGASAVIN